MTNAVIVVAGGRGIRAGGDMPKQYADLAGATVLARTVGAFANHQAIDLVQVVIHPDDTDAYSRACGDFAILPPTTGGDTRQGSVYNGLRALKAHNPGTVLIHDAARPFVSHDLVERVLAGLATHAGAIPATPVADTLKRGEDGVISETVDRHGLYAAQTPQGFRFADILAAHETVRTQGLMELTDDAAVAEHCGLDVLLVDGDAENSKITTSDDMDAARRRVASSNPALLDVRVGHGFDVHAFEPGDHVILCGVQVPHTASLKGHSDADVGMHALTDAIYGALGDGDIGTHFPPSDPQWRGAASDIFLAHAAARVRERGGVIGHTDVTLVCEHPKIGPHAEAMRTALARIIDIDPGRVSVKATTSERLGFTGRGEGIAAYATATVRLPL